MIPKVFRYTANEFEVKRTVREIVQNMERIRQFTIAQRRNVNTYNYNLKDEEYLHNTYRVASLISNLYKKEIEEIVKDIDSHKELVRYDPLNKVFFEVTASYVIEDFLKNLENIANDVGLNKNQSYHILQAILYMIKEKPKPVQEGIAPYEISGFYKKKLVEYLFGDKYRLAEREDAETLVQLDRNEDLLAYEKSDFEDLFRYYYLNIETWEYSNYKDEDDNGTYVGGSFHKPFFLLISKEEDDYFLLMLDEDFKNHVILLDSFALNEGVDIKPIESAFKLARALGYVSIATHWFPSGISYQTLLQLGFEQVKVINDFEFKDNDDEPYDLRSYYRPYYVGREEIVDIKGDAVLLWKPLQ